MLGSEIVASNGGFAGPGVVKKLEQFPELSRYTVIQLKQVVVYCDVSLPRPSYVVPFWVVYCNPLPKKNTINPKRNYIGALGQSYHHGSGEIQVIYIYMHISIHIYIYETLNPKPIYPC